MRVFVTGGTGLVGSHVIEQLRARGDQVLALARSDASAVAVKALGAEPLAGDVGDGAALERGVRSSDAVVHAAATVLSRGDWERYHAANVAPTLSIARLAATHGKRLVHLSSVAVYGRRTTFDGGPGSVTEDFGLDAPMFPRDHYARSKRESEQAIWRVRQETGLSAAAVRPCVIYGERDRYVAPRVARLMGRPLPMVIPGDGDNPLSVVYAGNVAAAVLAALDRPSVNGPFNVANDGAITLRGFLEAFARGLGARLRTVHLNAGLATAAAAAVDRLISLVRPSAPMATLKVAVQLLSAANPYVSSLAERELGWRPVVSPADAAERTGRWYRDPSR